MDNSKQEKLDLNMYGQLWSSSDINPDRLTSELNKIFTYNQAETNYRNTRDNYYDFHEEYAKSLAMSAALEGSAIKLGTLLGNIIDNLQVAIMATELTAEKTNNAMIRTLSTLNLPPTFGGVMQTSVIQSSTCMIGEIRLYSADSHPPFPWLFCNGTTISRIEYQRLFSVIGEPFGAGDGKITLNVPDFRDRFPLDLNSMASGVGGWGKGGNQEQTLTTDQMPTHQHSVGTLHTIHAGTHNHAANDPGHNYGGYTGETELPFSRSGHYGQPGGGHFYHPTSHKHSIPWGRTGITLDNDGTHSALYHLTRQ
ncbi:unnamed protein product [Rotaria socialis]|uniref:Phage tail collar domain-containing protein n=2 Tax=Rotaria socialis TaxID=392032 RepID=A0A820T991_9BILA|nr:unnamed protein product [Rotaria socialis]